MTTLTTLLSGTFAGVLGTSWVPAAQPAVTRSNSKDQIYKPWPMHHVCRDFRIANSLHAADVDGDGFDHNSVIDERRGLMTVIFHPGKNGDVRKEWPRLVLGQTGNPEYACLGGVDGDGALDIVVGGRRHPVTKQYAGFRWLRAPADPIKWSDGANTRDPWIGEKWDHLIPLDVDGNGDLDLLANVGEHCHRGSEEKDVSWSSVVWFENPLK